MKKNVKVIIAAFFSITVSVLIIKTYYNSSLEVYADANKTVKNSIITEGIVSEYNSVYKRSDIKKETKENKNEITNSEDNKEIAISNGNETLKEKSTGKIIVIDPGHANRSNLEKEPLAPGSNEMKIKDGGGAEGIATKTPEYEVNLQVAMKLKSMLEQKGYSVVMTKTSPSESLGNIERAEIGNKANAALVIRLHADSSENSSVRGASMLVPSPVNDNTKAIYNESKRCGQIILNTFTSELETYNRGVVEHSDMTGFNWSKVPVVLIEMGFLSNPDEDRLLSSESYDDKMAKALADGIFKAVN